MECVNNKVLEGKQNILSSLEGLGFDKVRQGLVSTILEKTLLDIGSGAYYVVIDELKKRYRCHITDCYIHPEYLNNILQDLYGDASMQIVRIINKKLEEFSYQKPIAKFMESLSQ